MSEIAGGPKGLSSVDVAVGLAQAYVLVVGVPVDPSVRALLVHNRESVPHAGHDGLVDFPDLFSFVSSSGPVFFELLEGFHIGADGGGDFQHGGLRGAIPRVPVRFQARAGENRAHRHNLSE